MGDDAKDTAFTAVWATMGLANMLGGLAWVLTDDATGLTIVYAVGAINIIGVAVLLAFFFDYP